MDPSKLEISVSLECCNILMTVPRLLLVPLTISHPRSAKKSHTTKSQTSGLWVASCMKWLP